MEKLINACRSQQRERACLCVYMYEGEKGVLALGCLWCSAALAGYVTRMPQYLGQQHRESQGWGRRDEVEQCVLDSMVRLSVSVHSSVFQISDISTSRPDTL